MTLTLPLPFSAPSQTDLLPRRKWTVAEFERAADLGVFGPEERLELIDGDILPKQSQSPPDAVALTKTERALRPIFGDGFVVRGQSPLDFGAESGNRPEPDIAVVEGAVEDFIDHPTTAVLVVEISGATLAFDRETKAAVYARAQVPELWIVNLLERVLEVYRQPSAMPTQPLGHHYRSITRFVEGDTVAPLAVPNATVSIADLLPPPA